MAETLPTAEQIIPTHGIVRVCGIMWLLEHKYLSVQDGFWLFVGRQPKNEAEAREYLLSLHGDLCGGLIRSRPTLRPNSQWLPEASNG